MKQHQILLIAALFLFTPFAWGGVVTELNKGILPKTIVVMDTLGKRVEPFLDKVTDKEGEAMVACLEVSINASCAMGITQKYFETVTLMAKNKNADYRAAMEMFAASTRLLHLQCQVLGKQMDRALAKITNVHVLRELFKTRMALKEAELALKSE